MPFTHTGFPGLMLFNPTVFEDSRGYFYESYNENVCRAEGINTVFVQDNQAKSSYGVIRGLHYQLQPFGQVKFIRVLSGTILDVAVDIRKGSPTFGKVFQVELSEKNRTQLYIPKGFAHGYSVLSKEAEVFYKCDVFYNKESEAGIIYNDPTLDINWQIPAADQVISDKDRHHPQFGHCSNNFVFPAR